MSAKKFSNDKSDRKKILDEMDSENLAGYRLALAYLQHRENEHLEELKLLNQLLNALEDLDAADPKLFNQSEIKPRPRKDLSAEEIRRDRALANLKTVYGRVMVLKAKQHLKEKWAEVRANQAREEGE